MVNKQPKAVQGKNGEEGQRLIFSIHGTLHMLGVGSSRKGNLEWCTGKQIKDETTKFGGEGPDKWLKSTRD